MPDPDFDLTPTVSERLWLRRRRVGATQEEMARRLGLGEKEYHIIERGLASPSGIRRPTFEPSLGERCELARRRSGTSLGDLARLLGVSRVTVRTWERGGDPRLVAAWERLGYIFKG